MSKATQTPHLRLHMVGLIFGIMFVFLATLGSAAWAQENAVTPAGINVGTTVDAGPAPGPINLGTPNVTVPVTITRDTGSPAVMAFSVRFTVSSLLSLPSGRNSITLPAGGGFLNADGGRNVTLQTVDLGGGVYQADGTTLGAPCGSSALSGTLFNIELTSAALAGTGTVTIDNVVVRNCSNGAIASSAGTVASVTIDRTAPAIAVTSPDGGEIWTVGSSHNITWTATDAEGIASVDLAYTTDGSTWIAITTVAGNPGTYAWTIPNAVSTTVKVRATAHDVNGNDNQDSSDADFEIRAANTPPVLGSIGDKTIDELVELAFTAGATDTDLPAQTLTYSLDAGAPAGASINPTTGAFSWTPTEAQGPGSYPVTVRVTDDGLPAPLDDFETITVTVDEVNLAPALTGVPASATIPEQVAYGFDADATDADLPAQTLTFSLVGGPAGASIDPGTGVFSWTPSEAQGPGIYTFSVRVSDGVTNTDASITLTVDEVNLAPVLASIGDQTIDELTELAFTASATDADLPAQTLTYSLDLGAPAGASINPATGAFSWTPTEAQGPGSYSVTVRVTDNGSPVLDDFETITVTVDEVNLAPALTGVPASATIPEQVAYGFDADATDADLPAQTLTFSLVGGPAGASIDPGTGVFSWTPSEAQGPGSYTFSVRVSDGVTNTDASITLTVDEVNLAPVLASIGDQTIDELTELAFTASATDADLPAQTLTYSLDLGAPAGASINPATGAFSWTPTEAQGPGSYSVTVRVTDNGTPALDDFETITVTVDEVNLAPALTGVPASATIPEQVAYGFDADATDADLPAQTLTFSLVGGPAGASIDPGTGVFSWIPSEAQGPGIYTFSVRVSDGVTNTDASITITVDEVNLAPALTGVPASASIPEQVAYSFDADATDADLPAQTLTFSLVGGPAGASIDPGTGVFSWTPSEAQGPGIYTFSVRVSDGVTNTDASITLTVDEVNLAPVLASIGDQTIDELVELAFTASATDADLPAQTLTYSLDAGAPAGASINPATGAFSWTPTEAQGPGSYSVTVRVTDNGSPALDDFETITVTVNEVNLAPALTGVPASATIPEQVAYGFDADATDADLPAQTLTFSLVGGPAGASIDPGTGVFSWTPSEAQGPGSYTFSVRVSDGVTNTDASITLTVDEVNLAPVLASIGDQTIDELTELAFAASATDADLPAQTLTYSLDLGAPAGASINPATGAFSWTPTEAQGPGSYSVTVRVTDNGSPALDDFETITVTVDEVNVSPVLASIGDQTIDELVELAFTASATDADLPAQTLTYSLDAGAPAGASINPTTGAFSWTPTEAQGPGSYSVTVRVTDDGAPALDDFETITVTVNEVNLAPALTGVPASATIPEQVAYGFDADATDADLPAQTLTFSLVGGPAGASIDPGTGVFSWTPSEAQGPGSYTFSVRVSDGVTNTDASITLTVDEVNVSPVLASIGDQTIDELVELAFTASATDADLPAQTLTYSLDAGAPAGASINPTTGAFSWTPTEAQGPGSYSVTVRVTDDGSPVLDDFETITVTVNEVNLAPALTGVPASATIPEQVAYGFDADATDADLPAQTLTFSLVGGPAGASIDPGTGVFSWTPSEAQGPGSYTFSVRVSDGVTNTDASITLTVDEVNVSPVLASIGDQTIDELVELVFAASATDADLPAQTLTYSLDAGAPAGASINLATGAFSWTPTEAQGPGSYSVTVRVTDNGSPALDDFETITITVDEVNLAPALTGVPASATIPEQVAYGFDADATDADLPAQTLTFSLVGGPAGASIDPGTGVFSWTPSEAQGPGIYTFSVRVSDGVTNTDASITLTVDEVNLAPVLASIGDQTIDELVELTFTASATDADLPAQTLTYSLDLGAPAGASINPATGAFSWTPTEAQGPGSYSVTVRVTDNGSPALDDFETITLTVDEVNLAPVLASIGDQTIDELVELAFTASATDADLPAQTLTYSLDLGAPAGASINPATGAFSWTPTEAQGPGSYSVTVRVTDNGSPVLDDFETITVTVDEVNLAPALTGVPASATIPEQVAYGFDADATDADLPAQTLTFSLVGGPAGASIDPGTGVFSWTPSEAQGPGSYTFSVRVSDGVTNTDASITLDVTESNAAPVLASIGDQTIDELVELAFTASATDADLPAQTLTYSLDLGAPAAASINPTTGAFSWTPTEAQGPGSYSVTVRVTDNGTPALDDFETITITVDEVNLAPVLASIGDQTIDELVELAFTASATDADLPAQTLTYSLDAGAPAGASINPATGAFSWTPTEAQGPGSYSVTVRVTDNGAPALDDFETITITVDEVNLAPALTGVPASATIPEQVAFSFDADATDADLPAQTLTFSLVGAPAGASIDPGTGVFSWTPNETQGPDSYTFSVRVTDGVVNTDASITITVTEVNVAPVLADVPASATIPELVAYTFTASATDPEAPPQTLTFSLLGEPAGAAIDPGTGVFAWTPGEAQGPGSYAFTVRVSDGVANTDAPITLTVTEVNVAPVLADVPASATIPELVAYTFTATATDSDVPVQTLTFSLVGGPAGAAIDPGTGVFTWTPAEAQGPGTYDFTVRVTDGVTNTDAPIEIVVDEVSLSAIADLNASQVTTGNPVAQTTSIAVSWSETPEGTTVEVYRAPFGTYPEYDDMGGVEPAMPPAYPPGAPWVLTTVSTPGGEDLTAARGYYYYVAYVKGAGANISGVSNRTSGTLNYHLGDVTDATTPGVGNNSVSTEDVSLLGAHYGISLALDDPYNFLDVGPTSNMYVDGLPSTDNLVAFEDLVMFAINYNLVSAVRQAPKTSVTANEMVLEVPEQVAFGTTVTAQLLLRSTGAIVALSAKLAWDPAVVEPVSQTPGEWLAQQGGIAFSAKPGTVDAAVFGSSGISGEGVLATVTFRVLAAGDPKIRFESLDGRDARNQALTLGSTVQPAAPVIPVVTALKPAAPNPFRHTATIAFSLSARGPVELSLYSVDGRRVRTLVQGQRDAGEYHVTWNGRDEEGRAAAAGIYYARLVTAQGRFTRTIAYLK